MKNITLSADDKLIDAARARASAKNTTLDAEFRIWLEDYVDRGLRASQARDPRSPIQNLYRRTQVHEG